MKQLATFYGRHFLWLEFLLALGLTGLFVYWTMYHSGWGIVERFLLGNRGAVYGSLASILGSLLGFVIAAVAIVLGYSESPRLEVLRISDSWTLLWRVFTASMRALSFATLAALAALIFDHDGQRIDIVVYLFVFGVTLSVARLLRVIWIMEAIIQIVTKPRKAE